MKFNQELFDTSDEEGKQLLIAFLEKKGHEISQNCDKYGIDLFSEKDGKTYNWEVEMKSRRPWVSEETFPFDSVSFLNRKKKWDNFCSASSNSAPLKRTAPKKSPPKCLRQPSVRRLVSVTTHDSFGTVPIKASC